jgi:hypothetical protein
MRHVAYISLKRLALIYRKFRPHPKAALVEKIAPVFSETTNPTELQGFIKGSVRFEHLIAGASDAYKKRREEIATSAYNPPLIRLKKRKA